MEEEADKVNARRQYNPSTLSFVRQWKSQRNGGRPRVGVHSEQLRDPKKEKEETWIHFLPIVILPFWES